MSAILKMLEAADKASKGPWELFADGGLPLKVIIKDSDAFGDICKLSVRPAKYDDGCYDAEFIAASRNATADIQRLVSWVESAPHKNKCELKKYGIGLCTCGLDEIQSLLRS